MWEPQVTALADAFRVIRWDRRGFGLSSGRPSLAKDVSDIRALCRHLEVQQAAFVGMSQGARVVLQLADICPALVASLILDGPPTLDTAAAANAPPELPYEYYRSLVRTHGMAAFRREWLEHPLAQLRTGDPHARDLLLRMIGR